MSVYSIVTERIVKMLESGTVPWRCPWIGNSYSKVTGKPYSLLNQILLSETGPGAYASFAGWQKLGGKVKRGAKAGIVCFWKLEEKENKDGEIIQRPILRYYHVFHESMVEGIDSSEQKEASSFEDIECAETTLLNYVQREGILLEEKCSNRAAFFSPSTDLINLPSRKLFSSSAEFIGVFAHEAIHSTGMPTRLNRKGLETVAFGSEIYGREELIAEIGSCFLLAKHGIDTQETFTNHIAYIQNWMSAIKNDDHMIVNAVSAAERAVAFILGEDNQ